MDIYFIKTAATHISVWSIATNNKKTDVTFTVKRDDMPKAKNIINELKKNIDYDF